MSFHLPGGMLWNEKSSFGKPRGRRGTADKTPWHPTIAGPNLNVEFPGLISSFSESRFGFVQIKKITKLFIAFNKRVHYFA